MRALRSLLVGISVGALALGTATAVNALEWQRPGGAPHGGDHGGKPQHISEHVNIDKSRGQDNSQRYRIHRSCKGGTFGYCNQDVRFNPELIGDVNLIGTGGLIGLNGDNGDNGGNGNNGTNGTNGTNGNNGEPQWCSPGYWRNHPESWGPTGLNPGLMAPPGTPYSSVFMTNQPVLKPNRTGPANPTLMYVLVNGQDYQNPGFHRNRIADELSERHPGVNYEGVRVENSCPLN